jgi:hypothetical protein
VLCCCLVLCSVALSSLVLCYLILPCLVGFCVISCPVSCCRTLFYLILPSFMCLVLSCLVSYLVTSKTIARFVLLFVSLFSSSLLFILVFLFRLMCFGNENKRLCVLLFLSCPCLIVWSCLVLPCVLSCYIKDNRTSCFAFCKSFSSSLLFILVFFIRLMCFGNKNKRSCVLLFLSCPCLIVWSCLVFYSYWHQKQSWYQKQYAGQG